MFDFGILPSKEFRVPVISVGNITVGGTGKTPHTEYLIQLLQSEFQLAVLSRGYKRKSKGLVLASEHTGVKDVGDEPLQIKYKYPDVSVAVDGNRVKGIRDLIRMFPDLDVILLDDAYQHRYVKPGLSILLVDYSRPIFNDFLLPAGDLRESAKNTDRADIIIVTKCPDDLSLLKRENFKKQLRLSAHQDVFFTTFSYGSPLPVFGNKNQPYDLKINGSEILLFTGIANPMPLKKYLNKMDVVSIEKVFPDHHNYNSRDIHWIIKTFEGIKGKPKYIFTTEKDAVRVRELDIQNDLFKNSLYYIPVMVKFLADGEQAFNKRVREALA